MRAAKWKLDDGKRRIKGTIEWRREYKPDLISAEHVKIENDSGKMWVLLFALALDSPTLRTSPF